MRGRKRKSGSGTAESPDAPSAPDVIRAPVASSASASAEQLAETGIARSEQHRERLRKTALSNLYFFNKAICGFRDLDPDLHGEMCRWYSRPTTRKLGLAPRDHLKTSCFTIGGNLYHATRDPNTRILIINETVGNAANFISKIQAIVLKNELYRWLFPEVLPNLREARWTREKVELARTVDYPEVTIEAAGVGGASTSRHYNRIHEDDLVGREASRSAVKMADAIEQHKLAESLLNAPGDTICTVGTRWAPHDLVDWMLRNERDLDYFCLSHLKPDGTPIWPGRFSKDDFDRMRAKYGAALFALQYENRVIASGLTDFQAAWLRNYSLRTDRQGETHIELEDPLAMSGNRTYPLSECTVFAMIDPNLKADSRWARTAIVTVALTPAKPYDIVVLGAAAEPLAPKQTLQAANDQYLEWKPLSVGLEVVAGQMFLYEWALETFPDLPLVQLKTDASYSKRARIRSIAPYAEQGRLYIRRDQANFIEEWESFPGGRTVDLLDALAYGPQIWYPPEPEDRSNIAYDEFGDPIYADLYHTDGPAGRSPLTGY